MVFNAALFDFHPETWVMPAFALALWAERSHRPRLWFGLLLLMLGCRDGLVLVTAGMAIDLAFRRRWRWSLAAAGLSGGWLLMVSRWLYPLLRDGNGLAASRMFSHLNGDPLTVLRPGLERGAEYLLPLCLPCTSCVCRAPQHIAHRAAVGAGESAFSLRQLPHPGASLQPAPGVGGRGGLHRCLRGNSQPRRGFAWMLGRGLLAGPSQALGSSALPNTVSPAEAVNEARALIQPQDAVLTTSYLRHSSASGPASASQEKSQSILYYRTLNVLLLNPTDPGWGQVKGAAKIAYSSQGQEFELPHWPSGLELCRAPAAATQQPRRGNAPSGNRPMP